MLDRVCNFVSKFIREKTTIEVEGNPYLTRFYIFRHRRGDDVDKEVENSRFGLYLHQFHRGDDDSSLHNHPFKWSLSLILSNGYFEERWNPTSGRVEKRTLKPGSFNFIRADDFHRVDLIDPEKNTWTLFLTGNRLFKVWGFWNPGVHKFIPHTEFERSLARPENIDKAQ